LDEGSVALLGEKVRQKLTVDEGELSDWQLDALRKYIGLTRDGKVIYKVERSKLSQRHRILLYAIGKYLAHEAGYASEPYVTVEELANELGLRFTDTGIKCSELWREGLLLSIEKGYRVLLHRAVETILVELTRTERNA
jgi:hypothetical protein